MSSDNQEQEKEKALKAVVNVEQILGNTERMPCSAFYWMEQIKIIHAFISKEKDED